MLHTLPSGPAVAAVLDESRSQLQRLGLTADIDAAAALLDTTNVQIALVIAGVACTRALTDDHGLTPQFVAGHSVAPSPPPSPPASSPLPKPWPR